MGAAFPSLRPGSQARQGASFRLSALLATAGDQANTLVDLARIQIIKGAKGSGISTVELLRKASSPFPKEAAAQRKAELQFQSTQAKAESDFIARIQSAIDKQLSSFTIPTATAQQPIIQTPMIESESQVKQELQSPVPLIPLAIIGVILGAILLG